MVLSVCLLRSNISIVYISNPVRRKEVNIDPCNQFTFLRCFIVHILVQFVRYCCYFLTFLRSYCRHIRFETGGYRGTQGKVNALSMSIIYRA